MSKIYFPILMWLSSRLVIFTVMLLIVPLFPTLTNGSNIKFGTDVFSAWDSIWYERVAINGYDYSALDNKEHSIAFFPLFPLLLRALMTVMPIQLAGIIINNLAFLAALIILYVWVEERNGKTIARWATATLAWCPYSLYGTVIYTEGLFLLCSTAALQAFDKQQYIWVSFWGGLATATRVTGAALIPTFLLASWWQRRTIKAYIASLAVASGLCLFSLYCLIKFGDPLAFLHAQKGWRPSLGFAWDGWWTMLRQILLGVTNIQSRQIVDFGHPFFVGITVATSYLLWYFRKQLGPAKVCYGFYALWFSLWLWTREPLEGNPLYADPLLKLVLIFGGVGLLWFSRNKIPLVAVIYGFCSFGIILNTGLITSVERYTYGVVSLSFAAGLLLARYPRWGYPAMGFFAIVLAILSLQFAQKLWVA